MRLHTQDELGYTDVKDMPPLLKRAQQQHPIQPRYL
jgi:hypothetical protein